MSGLEPLAVLGLICNIVQLVEVGLKTTKLCKNAYRTGEPDPELSVHAQNLAATASSLTQLLETSLQPLSLDDFRLLTLARDCRDAEQEWRKKTPARFLSQQQPRRRDRFEAVVRGIFNKPEIYRLESQLQKAKCSLETDLLVGVFKRLDISRAQIDDLQIKLQILLQASSACENELRDVIQRQVNLVNTQISDCVDRVEASTKAYVTAEIASHESRLRSYADQGREMVLRLAESREESDRENKAYEGLLCSFRYQDMEHRKNDIRRRHKSTFNWIFKESTLDTSLDPVSLFEILPSSRLEQRVWSGFVKWLISSKSRYWISGKPGTGKSVLMKFIVSDQRTIDLLQQWQPGAKILTHFFWKVGSPMQSSFKGFLCSLVYQLFSLDREGALCRLQKNPDWSRKTGPGDWDNEDLKYLLSCYLTQSTRPFCLFIDGLDEIVEGDDIGTLISFLDNLQSLSSVVKICMSSRPEQVIRTRLDRDPHFKMQDLTLVDIQRYINDGLTNEPALATSPTYVLSLVRQISSMAEGVFLWAVLVTKSITRGISNGDSEEVIQKRLLKTPRELHKLYFSMWARLGEDSDFYQNSAALIFKILLFIWQAS